MKKLNDSAGATRRGSFGEKMEAAEGETIMVHFEKFVIPAASLGPLNPMPDIKNVSYIHAGYEMTDRVRQEEKKYIGQGMIPTMLPYRLQDGYDREKKPRAFQAAVVENDHVRAVFLPELGGRLYSIYNKDERKELLYVNPVFQPGNLGLRNAWFSGGVEFNVGIKGHNPLTCSPVFAAVDQTPEGEVLRLYEFERIRGVAYSVSAWVREDSPTLYLRCRIENRTDETKYMYWWSNIAVPETPGTRVIVPAERSFLSFYNADHYILDKTDIPMADGVDVSYPTRIPSSRDFFYQIPDESPKWIASANEEGYGLLQCSTRRLFGRKMFVWGMGQGGRHWNEWLSEEGSAYIEIQAGLAHTQLEHIPMAGRTVWEWQEAYTLLKGDPKVLHGEYGEAVRAVRDCMKQRVGDPDEMHFPADETVTHTKLVCEGSGWGHVEEVLRGEPVSVTLAFPKTNDPESAVWLDLLEKGNFPCPDPMEEPAGYVMGREWLEKLEALPEQNWYSLLQQGVIRYAMAAYGDGSVDGARKAWEQSLAVCENPWALRNLAMLYKSEYHLPEKARELLLAAFRLKPDCRALAVETAMQLTEDGSDEKWLELYDELSPELQAYGRLRLLRAVALLHIGRLEEAAAILNVDFVMPDVKEGELSVSYLWFELYRRLYAKEQGVPYDPEDEALLRAADEKYPLPKTLDFRMH